MKRKTLEIAKDVLIAVLICSLVLLVRQLLPGASAEPRDAQPIQTEAEVAIASKPIVISLRGEIGRASIAGDETALEMAWEQWGSLLGQAMETAQTPQEQPEEAFLQALEAPSVLFSFAGRIPSQAIGAWLGAPAAALDGAWQDYLLSVRDGSVYLWAYGEPCQSCKTQLPAQTLEGLLSDLTPDGSAFYFERTDDRAAHPLTLWSDGAVSVPSASWENPVTGAWATSLATALSFNPYGSGTYTDPQGNTVFTESSRTLSVELSGKVLLQRTNEEGSLGTAGEQSASFVEAARAVAGAICADCGDAKLYLTDFSQDGDQTVCRFQYVLGGIPFSPDAAVVTFSGSEIVSVEALARVIHPAAGTETLMPVHAAAAISPQGSRVSVCYALAQSGAVTAGWIHS